MQEHDQHVSPIKIPKQLIVIVVLAFVVPISLGILLSQLVTSSPKGAHEDDSAILARIQPVGQVQLAAPAGPKGQLTGEQVYGQVCKTCHEAGVLNAPKFGDKAAWAKVIAQGQATTVGHALSGIRAMPAKGGNPDLENVEVERARRLHGEQGGCQLEGAGRTDNCGRPGGSDSRCDCCHWRIACSDAGSRARCCAGAAAVAAAAPAAAAKPDGKKVFDIDVHGVPWRGHRGRAQVRRQGRVGAAPRDRHRHALQGRADRQGCDAPARGQQGPVRRRGQGRRRLHGRRSEVAERAHRPKRKRGSRAAFFSGTGSSNHHPLTAADSETSAPSASASPRAASRAKASCDR